MLPNAAHNQLFQRIIIPTNFVRVVLSRQPQRRLSICQKSKRAFPSLLQFANPYKLYEAFHPTCHPQTKKRVVAATECHDLSGHFHPVEGVTRFFRSSGTIPQFSPPIRSSPHLPAAASGVTVASWLPTKIALAQPTHFWADMLLPTPSSMHFFNRALQQSPCA